MPSRRALLGAGLLAPTVAYAQRTQGFPSRNLAVIVPFAPQEWTLPSWNRLLVKSRRRNRMQCTKRA
jgi:hypothetical protein